VGIGESLGKVGYLKHPATGNQQLTAIKVSGNADAAFVAWQLWAAREEIREWAQFSRVRLINNDTLKAFPIWLPDVSEQVQARQELDRRRVQLIQFRHGAMKFIEVAMERRQALVAAAVTGQFDVATARGADFS
jgi:type I restriction enzyme S subunit